MKEASFSNEAETSESLIIQSEVNQKDKHQYSILMHLYGI